MLTSELHRRSCAQCYGCGPFYHDSMRKLLRGERQGKIPRASPITPEQIEIRDQVLYGRFFTEVR